MKAGIYDPYLDTLGGGERYCLTLAEFLLNSGWEVDLLWEKKDLKEKIKEKFKINLEKANFVSLPKSLFIKAKFQRKYDLLFWLSDGSIPFMFGKKNILHFQAPFKNILKKTLKTSLKLKTINEIVCNSYFTKRIIDSCLGVNSKVIYPPVDVDSFKPLEKENIILFVGRFSQLLQSKGHDILVKAFKFLVDKRNLRKWKLILAGGTEVGVGDYLKKIKKDSLGYPIKIIENPNFNDLVNLYGKAKIFWSASGYGVDEEKEPEKVEHFGISVVEAMSAGAVPLTVKKGGFKEIIEEGKNGFFWQTPEELEEKTLRLIKIDLKKLQNEAIKRSKIFSKEKFYENFQKII